MSTSDRDENIDFLKGIAIFLVVLGHLIQYILYPEGYIDNIFFRLIYAVHMPLFMFISGYVVGMRNQTIDIMWLKRKTKSLMLPFLSWVFIAWIIHCNWEKNNLLSYYVKILLNPSSGGMWFLCVLFLNCVGLFLATRILRIIQNIFKVNEDMYMINKINTVISMGIIFILIKLFNNYRSILGSELCEWHIRFYFLGILLGKEKIIDKLKRIKNLRSVMWLLGGIYLFLVYFWQWGGEPLFIEKLDSLVSMNILVRGVNFAYRHLVPIIGIAFIICFVLSAKNVLGKHIVCYLGKLSLEIYLIQWYFLINYTGNKWVDAMISFCLIMQAAFWCDKYISKRGVFGMFLFGKV